MNGFRIKRKKVGFVAVFSNIIKTGVITKDDSIYTAGIATIIIPLKNFKIAIIPLIISKPLSKIY